jgi:hypothetical protein
MTLHRYPILSSQVIMLVLLMTEVKSFQHGEGLQYNDIDSTIAKIKREKEKQTFTHIVHYRLLKKKQ